MGFFSKALKKVTGFIKSIFRDVEGTERTVEDTIAKAFREFQEFIEEPIEEDIEFEEEPEEEPEEYFRKIVKTTGYSFGRKETLYALTFEDNTINRFKALRDKIFEEFNDSFGIQNKFGYDQEEATMYPEIIYPDIEVGEE